MDIKQIYDLFRQLPGLTTDTRECQRGAMFLALKGPHFDGNEFAERALNLGCSYAVVDNPQFAKPDDPRYILTDNCIKTLQLLAREHRRQFDIPVIAVTGTNGKTTTKELIAQVLAEKMYVLKNKANHNNDIGVPKTLLRLNSQHQVAVIEMGASHPGDIKTLAETAEPNIGLITNVGLAHLQGFHSLQGVIEAKGELFDFLKNQTDSAVIVDGDNEHLMKMAEPLGKLTYGIGATGQYDVEGQIVRADPMLLIRWRTKLNHKDSPQPGQWHYVGSNLIGNYNIQNLIAAVAVGVFFGLTSKAINDGIEKYIPALGRSEWVETSDNNLMLDAYNANPTSMKAAIRSFALLKGKHKMAIIGQMNELGDASLEEHSKLLDFLAKKINGDVWLVGELFKPLEDKAKQLGFLLFDNTDELKNALNKTKPAGKLILIKGSNSLQLNQIVPLL